ncbi:MAG: nicotinate-nucleotide--dimethylbenzimidazole phosphoribosyltransferase [Lachnospiraceae bacterium]|nr:nicotinate-nucleotide--dimethylbenzimidazole phosphoribosyltransferase [Lachnospiraceae bacterium]
MTIRNLPPREIENESFAIIEEELKGRILPEDQAPVIKRVIHTTADFSFADTLWFSEDAVWLAKEAIRGGATVVTDTQMGLSGINKKTLERFGGQAVCYMSDPDVAEEAKKQGCTRARVSMDKAARLGENVIYAIGNAPTALIRLRELIDEGYRPKLIIGVPVGFVNVVASKELIIESGVPCIVARGRKGGSNVAACIVNALLYAMDETRGEGGASGKAALNGSSEGLQESAQPGTHQQAYIHNSSSFFQNRDCRYFPCHEGADPNTFNCLYCYCPLYMLGERCGGHFRYTKKGIKDCTLCTVPHQPDAAEYVRTRFAEIAERAGIHRSELSPVKEEETETGRALLARWNGEIPALSEDAMVRARAHWDSIAKPLHGLGKLEDLVVRIAGIEGSENVSINKRAVAVLCADNGIVAEGVTQTDASVTATMASRVAGLRSSVCLMAKTVHADVFAFDMGMLHRVEGVRDMHVADGTANMAEGPAMTEEQAVRAIKNGVTVARELASAGYRVIVTGEMGIGNTSSASALAAVLLGLPVDMVTGRGAGLSDEGLARKRKAIEKAIEVNRADPADALDVLAKLGGFDLAGMVGVYIGAALSRVPVLIDGFPSSAAALAAARIVPNCAQAMIASHCSKEPAAQAILKELGLDALIYADMKLGEGTGAVLLLPMLDAALSVYNSAVSFEETGIPQYTPQGGNAT